MKIARDLPEEIWQQFLNSHPSANIFHTPEMFRVFAKTKGYQSDKWFVVDDNEQVVTLFTPVRLTMFGKLLHQFTARSVAYGSVLTLPTQQGLEGLDLLLTCYQHNLNEPLFTEFRNLTNLDYLQPVLTKHNYIYEDHLNYLIDLNRPVEEIWRSLHGNVRTNVRKAEKLGVEIKVLESFTQIQPALHVLIETYKYNQIPLAPPSLFQAAFDVFAPQGMIKFLAAYFEDHPIGIAIRLLFKQTIYAWYVGIDRRYTKYKANDFLNWYILKWGAENGYHIFDFGGAGKPDQDYGPRRFKAKFGGTLVNYGRNINIHRPNLLKLSKLGYRVRQRFL